MVQRHQISGNGLLTKLFAVAWEAVAVMGVCGCLRWRFTNLYADIGTLLLFSASSFFVWWAFSKVHPVYFDDTAFYWTKRGEEQKVDYTRVASLLPNWLPNRDSYSLNTITLNYTDTNGKSKSIDFFPVSEFKYNPLWVLVQCENAIKLTRPHFQISNSKTPLDIERELDKERKYKVNF